MMSWKIFIWTSCSATDRKYFISPPPGLSRVRIMLQPVRQLTVLLHSVYLKKYLSKTYGWAYISCCSFLYSFHSKQHIANCILLTFRMCTKNMYIITWSPLYWSIILPKIRICGKNSVMCIKHITRPTNALWFYGCNYWAIKVHP
jgi:hypothetical protein